MEEGKVFEQHEKINWSRLYKDARHSWLFLFSAFFILLGTLYYLYTHGHFGSQSLLPHRMERVRVLEVHNSKLSPYLYIHGAVSNFLPLKISMPKGCVMSPALKNKEVTIEVKQHYRPFNKSVFLEYSGLGLFCETKSK